MYLYEIHLHDSACSKCARSTVEEYVDCAVEKGIDGLVFTNHFLHGNTAVERQLPWHEFVDAYRLDFEQAREYGARHGVDVLFGIEEGYGAGKEALLYGLYPEEWRDAEECACGKISVLSAFARQHGGFIAAAHPFRVRNYIAAPEAVPDPALFDGVEIYNRSNHFVDNLKAVAYAERNGLIPLSGGDVHGTEFLGLAGLCFAERQTDEKQFARSLRERQFELFIDGKTVSPALLEDQITDFG